MITKLAMYTGNLRNALVDSLSEYIILCPNVFRHNNIILYC